MSKEKPQKKNIPIREGSSLLFDIDGLTGKAKVNRIKGVLAVSPDGAHLGGIAQVTLNFNEFEDPLDVSVTGVKMRLVGKERRGLIPVETDFYGLKSPTHLSEHKIKFSKKPK